MQFNWIHIDDEKPPFEEKVFILAFSDKPKSPKRDPSNIVVGEWDGDNLLDPCCNQIWFSSYWCPLPKEADFKFSKNRGD